MTESIREQAERIIYEELKCFVGRKIAPGLEDEIMCKVNDFFNTGDYTKSLEITMPGEIREHKCNVCVSLN